MTCFSLPLQVDLVFGAHHHSYQRSCPVYQEKCQADGQAPVVVDLGMAGAGNSQNIQQVRASGSEDLTLLPRPE